MKVTTQIGHLTRWISPDVTALGILLALILLGLLPLEDAFAGLGSDTVMLLGLLIMTAALKRTSVVDIVSRRLMRLTSDHLQRLLLLWVWPL